MPRACALRRRSVGALTAVIAAPPFPGSPHPLFTIGHSTRSVEELAQLLTENGVELLADVRTIPRSRTNPQFNLDVLPDALVARRSSPIFSASMEPLSVLSVVWRSTLFTLIEPEAESIFTGPRTLETSREPDMTCVLSSVSCGTSIV